MGNNSALNKMDLATDFTPFVDVDKKTFDEAIQAVNKKKFRIDQVSHSTSILWVVVRQRRIGLYRTTVIDGTNTVVGRKTTQGYSMDPNVKDLF